MEQTQTGKRTMKKSFQNLSEKEATLGENLLSDPETALRKWNDAAFMLQGDMLKKNSNYILKNNVNCRIFNLPPSSQTSLPGNEDVKKFVQVTGTVVRMSARKFLEYQRQYVCVKCKYPVTVEAQYDKKNIIKHPNNCPNPEGCDSKTLLSFGELQTYNCKDYQEIKMQEDLSKLVGAVPNHMIVTLEDDLVNTCKPGESVTVTGVVTRRWSEFEKGAKIVVDIAIRANYLEVNNSSGHSIAVSDDIKQFYENFWKTHAGDPLVGRNIILKSIAPELFGLNLVKLALAIVLAGGSQNKENEDNTGVDKRSESHLLFVGDPGTGKSEMLRFASKIIPGSVLTTGVGSTGAGLTVTAVMDNGEWQLEAGALVMADGSLCCIDEFNSMKENDRRSIHEAMEQQTISVAKAGIVCKLKTRCTILASCNPKGNLDPTQPLCMNVAMSSPLLSRFDLIILLRDVVNEERDRKLAEYLLNMDGAAKDDGEIWTVKMLQAYYLLIRKEAPKITKDAETILSTYYQLQKQFGGQNKARTTVRLLESLIRLSQGHAKLMFHKQVEIQDTIFAIALIDTTMDQEALLLNLKLDNDCFSERPEEEYLEILEKILGKLNLDYIYEREVKKKRVAPLLFKWPAKVFPQKCEDKREPPKLLFTQKLFRPQEVFTQRGTTCLRAIQDQNITCRVEHKMSNFTEDGGSCSSDYSQKMVFDEEEEVSSDEGGLKRKAGAEGPESMKTCAKNMNPLLPKSLLDDEGLDFERLTRDSQVSQTTFHDEEEVLSQTSSKDDEDVVSETSSNDDEEEEGINSDKEEFRRDKKVEESESLLQMVQNKKITDDKNRSKGDDSGNFTAEYTFSSSVFRRDLPKIYSSTGKAEHSKPVKENTSRNITIEKPGPSTAPKRFKVMQSSQSKKTLSEKIKKYGEEDWDMDFEQYFDDIKSQHSQRENIKSKQKATEQKEVDADHLNVVKKNSSENIASEKPGPKKIPKHLQENPVPSQAPKRLQVLQSSQSKKTLSENIKKYGEEDWDMDFEQYFDDIKSQNSQRENIKSNQKATEQKEVDADHLNVLKKNSSENIPSEKPGPKKTPKHLQENPVPTQAPKRLQVLQSNKSKKYLCENIKKYGEEDWDMDFEQYFDDIKSQHSQRENIKSKQKASEQKEVDAQHLKVLKKNSSENIPLEKPDPKKSRKHLQVMPCNQSTKLLSTVVQTLGEMDWDMEFDYKSQKGQFHSITSKPKVTGLESESTQSDLDGDKEENEVDVESMPGISDDFDVENCIDWNLGEDDEFVTSSQVDKNKKDVEDYLPENKLNPKNTNFICQPVDEEKYTTGVDNTNKLSKGKSTTSDLFSAFKFQPREDENDEISKEKRLSRQTTTKIRRSNKITFKKNINGADPFHNSQNSCGSKNLMSKTTIFNETPSNKLKPPVSKPPLDDEYFEPGQYTSQISERLTQNSQVSKNYMKRVTSETSLKENISSENTEFSTTSSQNESPFSQSLFDDEDIDFMTDVNPFLQTSQRTKNPSQNRNICDMGQKTQKEFIRGKFSFKKDLKMLSRTDSGSSSTN